MAPIRRILALDPGCTFTGAAIGTEHDTGSLKTEIEVVEAWPGIGQNAEKIPSKFTYIGGKVRSIIGNPSKTEATVATVRYLKLLFAYLDNPGELPCFPSRNEIWNELAKNDRTVEEALADFLEAIRGLLDQYVHIRVGDQYKLPKDVIVAVPAMWSVEKKDAYLQVVKAAGFGPSISLISEPEAAAFYVINEYQNGNHGKFRKNDNIIVCDVGGLTTDLISYRIVGVAPLRMVEASAGTGIVNGGIDLTFEFEKHLQRIFGHDTIEKLQSEDRYGWESAISNFNRNKDTFSGQIGEDVCIQFPQYVGGTRLIDGSMLTVDHNNVISFFEPVIQKIVSSIEDQISAIEKRAEEWVSAIVLVGGLNQSLHIQNSIKDRLAPYNIVVPKSPWSAVVQGAAMRLLDGPMITHRISRVHYGVVIDEDWNPSKHTQKQYFYNDLLDAPGAHDCMLVIIGKGDQAGEDTPMSIPWYVTVTEEEFESQDMRVTIPLFTCDIDNAPKIFEEGGPWRHLCQLECNLGDRIPAKRFIRACNNAGEKIRRLKCQLCMKILSAAFSFELTVDDVSYAMVADFFG